MLFLRRLRMAAPKEHSKSYKTSLGGQGNAWKTRQSASLDEFVSSLERLEIVKTPLVGEAMRAVDRAKFVRNEIDAYDDSPQSIGYGATISAPHMHAWCLELFYDQMKEDMRVLDVGSGSGYLTCCMAWMLKRRFPQKPGLVYGIDLIPELIEYGQSCSEKANPELLAPKGIVSFQTADGWSGLPNAAPFDFIHVGAAARTLPQSLVDQLAPNGKMVIPVHIKPTSQDQALYLVTKPSSKDESPTTEYLMGVRYVPLVQSL